MERKKASMRTRQDPTKKNQRNGQMLGAYHKKTSAARNVVIKEHRETIERLTHKLADADAKADKLEKQLAKWVQLGDVHETALQDLEALRQELQEEKRKHEKREIIEFKDKRSHYLPAFRQMVGMAFLEGLPNACAEKVIRRVLEYADERRVGALHPGA